MDTYFLKPFINISLVLFFIVSLVNTLHAQPSSPETKVVGAWNITVNTDQGERPSWLKINLSGPNTLVGHYVGIVGSSRPVSKIKYDENLDLYTFTIPKQWEGSDTDLMFEFTLQNDQLDGKTFYDDTELTWTAKRAPSLLRTSIPVWGDQINLIDEALSKWNVPENNQFNVQNGVLSNIKSGGNLVTKQSFNDFKINLEFNIPEGSNSGLYLRGRYELQILDSYDSAPSPTNTTGAFYGSIAPTINASKQAGEWQTLEVILTGRVVNVILNGEEIICNRPIPGITGGAIDSNEEEPGPIMIQGDHGPVQFRNMSITPAVNI